MSPSPQQQIRITRVDGTRLFLLRSLMARSKRYFSDGDGDALLEALGQCRRTAIAALTRMPINSAGYTAVGNLLAVLDQVAEAVTGDREHFLPKLHSTPKHRS